MPAGQVLERARRPAPRCRKGSTVDLIVSSGPPTVVIPRDIVGKSVTEAAAELQAVGLTVSGIHGSPLGKVEGHRPRRRHDRAQGHLGRPDHPRDRLTPGPARRP